MPKIGPNSTGPFDFDNSLEAAGYDLVYIDFERNTDDITRNAEVFERVLQEVNAWKDNAHVTYGLPVAQNVVMGMSMGGLIARYGLAEMTKNPFPYGPPDTRLLVLHDSPQRGAYNPVGLQSFTRSCDVPLNLFEFLKVKDFKAAISDAVDVLDEPATQQLAILNAFNGRSDIRANTFIDGVYNDMVDFNRPVNAGRPRPTYDIVATSDGSQCGRGSGAPVGVELTTANTYTSTAGTLLSFLNPAPYLGSFYLGVRGAAYGLPVYGQQATISRMRVYIEYRIVIGRCPFCIGIPIRYNLLNESAVSPPNTLPYETLPGGTTNLDRESGGCGTTTGLVGLFLRTSLYNGDICFVPSYSALDVPTVTTSNAFAKYINNVTDSPSLPRVARYVAQANPTGSATEFNLNHLTFTPRNSEWIFNEMQRPFNGNSNPAGCSSECVLPADQTFAGPGTLCGTATYATPDRGPGYTYQWSATPAGLFTNPTGTGPTFVTGNVGDGSGTITLRIVGDCPRTLARPVQVGAPAYPVVQWVHQPGVCDNGMAFFHIANYDASLTYAITNRRYAAGGAVRGPDFWVKATGVPGGSFTLTARNDCGFESVDVDVEYPPCTGPVVVYRLVPNPATDEVLVQPAAAPAAPGNARAATASPGPPAGIATVRVYDGYGRLRLEQPGQGAASLRLRVGPLPAGLYVVHVLHGGNQVSRQQLQVLR